MRSKTLVLILSFVWAAACSAEVPRADIGYRGNGDVKIIEFMRGHYMSAEAGVAKYLKRHLEAELPPGQVIDKAYLLQRGATCNEGVPVQCTFNGTANEHFSGLPKANAHRAKRITKIEARILLPSAKVEVFKEVIYPDDIKQQGN